MGLFSKREAEPVAHPAVSRAVHVAAPADDVIAHLAAYSDLWSPKRATRHEFVIADAGGWTRIELPGRVHPWQLHNLAFWMLDCPGCPPDHGVVAESGPGPDHPAYRLVKDPEIPDALCGWDEGGVGWTVSVPSNDIVRGDEVPVGRSFIVPTGFERSRPVAVMLEDPGRAMNHRNESNVKNRRRLVDRTTFVI